VVHRSGIFYTPEGERKRILALPIEEGREYFKSKEDYLTFVTKRMIAYFDAKEKRPGRPSQNCMTPGSCFAPCLIFHRDGVYDAYRRHKQFPTGRRTVS
jgi:hypothetical protein